jgi:hypothetical protein
LLSTANQAYLLVSIAVEMLTRYLNLFALLLLIPLFFSGCSKDDPDYYCDYNFVITISPEGAGTVSECDKCGPEMRYAGLTAIPNQGYEFKEWILENGEINDNNPLFYFSYWCDEKGRTIRITAVFEEIEE